MTYYAVKAGYKTGIFDNWDECKKATSGYKDPIFKSFPTKDEAEAYFMGRDIYSDLIKNDIAEGFVVAFCDGSFDKEKNRYSYGVVIIDEEQCEHEICGSSNNAKYISTNNVIGEIMGAINAMDWAVSNNYEKLRIYHDYEGLSKWISGEWDAKSPAAKMFVNIFKEKFEDTLKVEFQKVKGHSNNKYNDKADELAKRALFEGERVPVKGDSWFAIKYFKLEELKAVLNHISDEYPNISVHEEQKNGRMINKLVLGKEKLTVNYFLQGNHGLLVQGANNTLFQIFTTYVNEFVGLPIENVFSNAYRMTVDKKRIDDNIQAVCPSFPGDYPDNIKRLIRQAVINLNYYVECEDYTQYVFPALRALEGHIKYLLNSIGITIQSKLGFKCFQTDCNGRYYLAKKPTIQNAETISQIEECYNHYNKTRHTLFHFGDILGNTDSTRMIETKADADEEIETCIKLMSIN